MKTKLIQDYVSRTPFEKFTNLTKRLFAVPKKELDEKLEEFKIRHQKRRAVT
jgi:hypothetical protein